MYSNDDIKTEIRTVLNLGGYVSCEPTHDERVCSIKRLYSDTLHRGTHLAEINEDEFDQLMDELRAFKSHQGYQLLPSSLTV